MANTQISEAIKQILENLVQINSVKKHLEILISSIESMNNELIEKEQQLNKEQDDIEALEKVTISSLFHKILGDKESQLDKEKQEYLSLAMKIKELHKSIELARFEQNIVESKVKNEAQLYEKLNELKEQRANEIINYNEPAKFELIKNYEDLDLAVKFVNELNEALVAGERVYEKTSGTLSHLQEAITLGQHDMMGNKYAKYDKRSHLDLAAETAYNAQILLNTFNRELKDIGISNNSLYIEIDLFTNFTDSFFDNLITDWIMQTKIKNTYTIVQTLHNNINAILQSIRSYLMEYEEKIIKLRQNIEQILLT
jgi:hypothetical protein